VFSICQFRKLNFHFTESEPLKQHAKLTAYEKYKIHNTYVRVVDAHGVNNLKILTISDQHAGLHAMIPHS